MKVWWSEDFDALARQMAKDRDAALESRGVGPFSKSCVVVGNKFRGTWLKEKLLAKGRVLANLDVKMLYEFVNDWLGAAIQGKSPENRRPEEHPYSKEVTKWRIHALLGNAESIKRFPDLQRYLKDSDANPVRRLQLAERLSKMYDDYQGFRPEMLQKWGQKDGDGNRWQIWLWQALKHQTGGKGSYDDELVEMKTADLSKAFDHGVPKYTSIHVFGVMSMPLAYIDFFKQLEETTQIPVVLYVYNPCTEIDWFSDKNLSGAKKEVIKELSVERRAAIKNLSGARRDVIKQLREGTDPREITAAELVESISHPILGSLGTGVQGLVGALVESGIEYARCPDIKNSVSESLLGQLQMQIKNRDCVVGEKTEGDESIEVHGNYSPRREIEALRQRLLDWLANPDRNERLEPRDVLVLCADWETYAPHIDAVFGSRIPDFGDGAAKLPSGAMPYALAARKTETPNQTAAAFLALLELGTKESRFGVEEIMGILRTPAVARKFGFNEDGIARTEELVAKANIHWGYDDKFVLEKLPAGTKQSAEPLPYTWRRGLDRLLLDAFSGDPADDADSLRRAGELGELAITGLVEGERADCVGRLNAFVVRAHALATDLRKGGSVDKWSEAVDRILDEFFADDDAYSRELVSLRNGCSKIVSSIRKAGDIAHGSDVSYSADEIFSAVSDGIAGETVSRPSGENAVLFAPMSADVVTSHKVIWICGLNDGAFPRIDRRPAFDELARHPSFLDPSLRDSDALALLECISSAGERLVFSYLARNVHNDKEMMPSVLLADVLMYLRNKFGKEDKDGKTLLPYRRYDHPLQSFSRKYFDANGSLPPSFDTGDYMVAKAAQGDREASEVKAYAEFAAFEQDVAGAPLRISVEDLATFFSSTAYFYLKRRAGATVKAYANAVSADDDALCADAVPPKSLLPDIMLCGGDSEFFRMHAKLELEKGHAPDSESAKVAISAVYDDRIGKFSERICVKKADEDFPQGFSIVDALKRTVAVGNSGGGSGPDKKQSYSVTFAGGGDLPDCGVIVDGTLSLLDFEPGKKKIHIETAWNEDAQNTLDAQDLARAWVRTVFAAAAEEISPFYTVLCCPGRDGAPRLIEVKGDAKSIAREIVSLACRKDVLPVPFQPGFSLSLFNALAGKPSESAAAITASAKLWRHTAADDAIWPDPSKDFALRPDRYVEAARMFWTGFKNETLSKPRGKKK